MSPRLLHYTWLESQHCVDGTNVSMTESGQTNPRGPTRRTALLEQAAQKFTLHMEDCDFCTSELTGIFPIPKMPSRPLVFSTRSVKLLYNAANLLSSRTLLVSTSHVLVFWPPLKFSSFSVHLGFVCLFEIEAGINSPCSPDWSQIQGDLSASASQVLVLQE